MNKTNTINGAKKVAGKVAGAAYGAKNWIAHQFEKPAVVMAVGLVLGAAAHYGVEKGVQSYRGHKYGPMGGRHTAQQ